MNEYIPKINPEWKALCPPLSQKEFSGLRTDIKVHGCLLPVLVDEKTGYLVDGHNRVQICDEEGLPFEVKMVDLGGTDPMLWIARNQMARRNLNSIQKVKMVMPLVPKLMEENEQHRREAISRYRSGVETGIHGDPSKRRVRDIISKETGVSAGQVARILKILECGDEDLVDKVMREEVTVRSAYGLIMNAEKAKKEAEEVVEAPVEEETEEEAPVEEEAEEEVPVEEEAEEEVPVEEEAEEEVPAEEETEEKVLVEEETEEEAAVGEETEEEVPMEEEAEEEPPEEEEIDDTEEPVLKLRETPLPPPPRRRAGDIVPGFGIAEILSDDMKGYVCPPDSAYDLPSISMGGFSEEQEVGQMDFQQIETKVNEVSGRFVMRMGTIVNKMNPALYTDENMARLREILTTGYDKIMKMLDEKGGNGNE